MIKDSGDRTEFEVEEWKAVVGYEGMYEVSNKGRVRSLICGTRISDKSGRILRQKMDPQGYKRVNLYKDRKGKALAVSRLVAMAFVPNPDNYYEVGHDDDDKLNNNAKNLYWTCHKENAMHNGLHLRTRDKRQKKIKQIAEALSTPIIGTSIETGEDIYFPSMQEAEKAGFSSGHISQCCAGIRKKHGNYTWRKA
jgi:hypothetical protein